MKKGRILSILIIVLMLLYFGGNAASKSTSPAEGSGAAASTLPVTSALKAESGEYDFGTISMRKGKVNRLFMLQNDSTEPLRIKKITTSCMCTEAFTVQDGERRGPFGMPGHGQVPLANVTVPAGGTVELDVVYDPAAHGPAGIGRIERAVFIEDESGSVQTIVIRAQVKP